MSPPNTTPTLQVANRYTSPAIHQLRTQCVGIRYISPATSNPLHLTTRYKSNTKTLKTHTLLALTCYSTYVILDNRLISKATRRYKPLHSTSYTSRTRYTLSTTIHLLHHHPLHLRYYKLQTVTLHSSYVNHPVRTSVTFHPLPATTQALHLHHPVHDRPYKLFKSIR